MPPLEAMKALFAYVAEVREKRREPGQKCDEENAFKKFGNYAVLKRWLDGMRNAASRREEDYARILVNDGFHRGRAASTIFYHPQTHVRVVVHGDDNTFAAIKSELREMRSTRCEWYDVKVRGLRGSGKRDLREIEMLR